MNKDRLATIGVSLALLLMISVAVRQENRLDEMENRQRLLHLDNEMYRRDCLICRTNITASIIITNWDGVILDGVTFGTH